MNEPITIDPEFQSLIPPLSPDEYKQLEENCRRDGILDSLKVWQGILIDGHNRYKISEEWDLNFQTEEMDFPNREAVIRWIILNQFGRRNLSAYDRSVLALKLKPMIAEKAKENSLSNLKQSDGQKSDTRGRTNMQLAKVAGVSHDTIHKVETIEAKASEPLKEQVKTGQKTINQAYIEIKESERKKADFSARGKVREAEERHEDFQDQKTVTLEEIQQDKKDSAVIAESKAREIKNALKKILFFGAAVSGGDMSFSGLKKYLEENTAASLRNDLDLAIEVLSNIRGCL